MSSVQTIKVSDVSQTVFSITLDFLKLSHLKIYYASQGDDFVEQSDFTLTGSSGNAELTIGGTFGPIEALGDIRVSRETPTTSIIEWSPGAALRASDLDAFFTQLLYLVVEGKDKTAESLLLDPSKAFFDAQLKRIRNLAAPVQSSDAVRLQDLDAAQFNEGSLPALDQTTPDGEMIATVAGAWVRRTVEEIRSSLGLGTSALRNVGVDPEEVLITINADNLYARQDQNLGDLNNATTARGNLGLGSVATLNAGTGPNEAVQLDGSGRLPAVDGRNVDLSNNASIQGNIKGAAMIAFTLGAVAGSDTRVPLDAGTGYPTFGNPNVSVNVATSVVTLQAGTYRIRPWLLVGSTNSTVTRTLEWFIKEIIGGGPTTTNQYSSSQLKVFHKPAGSSDPHGINVKGREFIFTTVAAAELEVTARCVEGVTDLTILDGQLIIERLN